MSEPKQLDQIEIRRIERCKEHARIRDKIATAFISIEGEACSEFAEHRAKEFFAKRLLADGELSQGEWDSDDFPDDWEPPSQYLAGIAITAAIKELSAEIRMLRWEMENKNSEG